MKYAILIVLALLANPLLAQQPSISYLMCDEAKSQLQIHGSFGIDSGSVSIEDTTLGIVSWSDSLIICDLPDSGKGAGGGVVVHTVKGISNLGILSIVNVTISRDIYYYSSGPTWYGWGSYVWKVSWRADIKSHHSSRAMIYSFEASKISKASCSDVGIHPVFWRDSSLSEKDSSFSAYGAIDLKNNWFVIHGDMLPHKGKASYMYPDLLKPKLVVYDSSGIIVAIVDSSGYADKKWVDHTTGSISFPPNPKSSVTNKYQLPNPIRIFQENNALIIYSENSLGPATASLYTIDGRLLKRTKLDISAPGIFSIDMSDVHTHFAILVLQTEKGIITKKILF